MSNQAIKIIYNGLNAREDISCERVFAVEKDFEDLLIRKDIPLYTLETGIPLKNIDMLGFSIGYELGMTSVLSMLDLGQIPLMAKDRTENDPIVIAGGCGVTNPAPLSKFFDAIFIGEAEDEMFDLIEHLKDLKKSGANRKDLLQAFTEHPSVWIKGKKAVRAIKKDFGQVPSIRAYNPLPSIKPVQDHGVVEIMRGCPNGCRFCHAGIYYRPQRMKDLDIILAEVDELVNVAGYKEISLTSLSSGDYTDVDALLEILTAKYKSKKISFQLPSLKVSSFTLPVLESISQTRKSGLTFAVETPIEAWQFSLNKEVYEEKLFDIIMNAKKRGWNKAKFYFMVGLPVGVHALGHDYNVNSNYIVGGEGTEERAIVDFMLYIQEKTRIQCNVNIGTFIPKPHTPYQWASQLTQEQSREKLFYIRNSLPKGKFRTSTHNQFVSYIEGLISRGDERVGDIILSAYKKGCRLDAWDDHIRKDIWQNAIEDVEREYGCNFENEVCSSRSLDAMLPWDEVDLGTSKDYYKSEWERSLKEMRSPICKPNCNHHCGLCRGLSEGSIHVSTQTISNEKKEALLEDIRASQSVEINVEQNIEVVWRAIFTFQKKGGSEYLTQLALVESFHKAFMRSNLPIMYSNGFNPLPRFELASSLSLGIKSKGEVASAILSADILHSDFKERLQKKLPSNIIIDNVFIYPVSNKKKRESLASLLWGSKYTYTFLLDKELVNKFIEQSEHLASLICRYNENENVLDITLPFSVDRLFRDSIQTYFNEPIYRCVDITRVEMYAKSKEDNTDTYYNYFDAYNIIANLHKDLLES